MEEADRAIEVEALWIYDYVEKNPLLRQEKPSKEQLQVLKKLTAQFVTDRARGTASIDEVTAKIEAARTAHEEYVHSRECEADGLSRTLESAESRVASLSAATEKLRRSLDELTTEVAREKCLAEIAEKENAQRKWRCQAALCLVSQTVQALAQLAAYKKRLILLRQGVEIERRVIFNKYQELRGNLRVFCRIRPTLPTDLNNTADAATFEVSTDGMSLRVCKNWTFYFDRVFDAGHSQAAVFGEFAPLIQSALDGYNVSIFAFGQSGSGKTFTMEGESGERRGVVSRSLELIFDTMKQLTERSWTYTAQIAAVEIYNDSVRDLLPGFSLENVPHNHNNARRDEPRVCDIRVDQRGNVSVTGLTWVTVTSAAEVNAALAAASRVRAVAATSCNAHSSRSHSIVQVKLMGHTNSGSPPVSSTLSFVDLAGSERVDKSQVTGDRLKEAQHINKSLSALGEVINAISCRRPHFPFRNSKLTLLLKDSLGGNAKTLMFVNVSSVSRSETLNSLRFATRAQKIDFKKV